MHKYEGDFTADEIECLNGIDGDWHFIKAEYRTGKFCYFGKDKEWPEDNMYSDTSFSTFSATLLKYFAKPSAPDPYSHGMNEEGLIPTKRELMAKEPEQLDLFGSVQVSVIPRDALMRDPAFEITGEPDDLDDEDEEFDDE